MALSDISKRSTSNARESAINMVAEERKRLQNYGNTTGKGARGKKAIGLLDTLESYEYIPLWHRLLSTLGYKVLMPNHQKIHRFEDEALDLLPAKQTCSPIKSSYARVLELIDQGIDGIFIPSYQSEDQCAVIRSYASMLSNNIPSIQDGKVKVISPILSDIRLFKAYDDALYFNPVLEALKAFDPATAPTTAEFSEALTKAIGEQRSFEGLIVANHRKAVEWVLSEEGRQAVVLAARTYELGFDATRSIDEMLTRRGFAVLSSWATKVSMRIEEFSEGTGPYFNHSSFMRWIAETSVDEPAFYIAFLYSKNCGYDSIGATVAQKILADGGRRSAVIVLDDSSESKKEAINSMVQDLTSEKNHKELEEVKVISPSQAIEFLVDGLQGQTKRMAVDNRFEDLPNTLCNTVAILFEDSYRLLKENPDLNEISLPDICKNCLVDALPSLLSRNLGRPISIIWNEDWEGAVENPKSVLPFAPMISNTPAINYEKSHQEQRRETLGVNGEYLPSIGIVGNPLLCLNPKIATVIVDMIDEKGGRAVLPDSRKLRSANVNYINQLRDFSDQGIDGVLYLQDAHCLREHAEAHDALRSLQKEFPSMHIISLDIDSNLSPVMLENRVVLLIQSSKDSQRGLN